MHCAITCLSAAAEKEGTLKFDRVFCGFSHIFFVTCFVLFFNHKIQVNYLCRVWNCSVCMSYATWNTHTLQYNRFLCQKQRYIKFCFHLNEFNCILPLFCCFYLFYLLQHTLEITQVMHRCDLQVCCMPMVHLECCCCFKVFPSLFPLSFV